MPIQASRPNNLHLALQYRPNTVDAEIRTATRITGNVPVTITNTIPLNVAFGGLDAFGQRKCIL